MKSLLLLAAVIMPVAAWAQSAPTYEPPAGLTASPSSTGAQPSGGGITTTPNVSAGMPATPSTPAAVAPAPTSSLPTSSSDSQKKPSASKSLPAGSGGAATVQEQKAKKVVTQITQASPIDGDQATGNQGIAASLPGLKSQPKLADIGDKLDYVQIVGTSNTTSATGGKRVGIQWTTITRTDTGQTLTIQQPLSSTVRLKGDILPAKTKITARGDADALYDGIRTLFDNQAPSLQTSATANGGAKSDNGGSGGGSSQSPTQGDVQARQLEKSTDDSTEDQESSPTFDTTTDGCSIRVDLSQMAAIQQEATTTTKDGTTTRGACEDSFTRYPLIKTGLGCDDVVGDTSAQGQTKLYYVGPDGNPVTAQECMPDAELIYPIVDETGTCTPFIDTNAGRVQDQVESIYRNNKAVRIVVQACHPTGDGYAIEQTAAGCDLRDDFEKHQTVLQERPFYTKGGEQISIGGCADSATIYPHQTEACSDIVDSQAMKVFKASRIFIDGPNGKQYRSECAPIDGGTDLLATTDGCETVHYDYPTAGQSRGASRLYYMSNGAPLYLTQCQENTTVYKWNFVQTGWQNDDSALTSTELLSAHITLPGGDTEVSSAAVRPESAVVPYVPQGTQDVPNGQAKTYEGCNAYSPTTRSQVYKRADDTTYTVAVGPGDVQGPVDECSRTTQTQQVWSHSCASMSSSCSPSYSQQLTSLWRENSTGQVTLNSAPNCRGGQYTINNASTGSWWNALQSRTVTTLPAGAGGGTTTGAWATTQYVQVGSFPVNIYYCSDGK